MIPSYSQLYLIKFELIVSSNQFNDYYHWYLALANTWMWHYQLFFLWVHIFKWNNAYACRCNHVYICMYMYAVVSICTDVCGCDGHAWKNCMCVCFSRAHIRRRHYRMITKRHSLDWPDHPTRVQLADKNKLGCKIYGPWDMCHTSCIFI